MSSVTKVVDQLKKMKIEVRKISDLLPYARNSRTHSDYQINQIASSIKEFGFTNPVLITKEGEIIAGHGRVLAAMRLSMEEVPCITLGHLTDIQRRAYVIADNQLALNAGWDYEMLQTEIDYLKSENFDVDLIGFPDTENFEFNPPNEDEQSESSDEYKLVIKFDSEEDQEALFAELRDRGFKVKA